MLSGPGTILRTTTGVKITLVQVAEPGGPEEVIFKVNCKSWVGVREGCENTGTVFDGGQKLEESFMQREKLSKGLEVDLWGWTDVQYNWLQSGPGGGPEGGSTVTLKSGIYFKSSG